MRHGMAMMAALGILTLGGCAGSSEALWLTPLASRPGIVLGTSTEETCQSLATRGFHEATPSCQRVVVGGGQAGSAGLWIARYRFPGRVDAPTLILGAITKDGCEAMRTRADQLTPLSPCVWIHTVESQTQ
jgi:hypothetical protein